MPSIVHFYRITPGEFWELPIDEIQSLIAYRDAVAKAREKAAKKQSPGRRR